MLKGVGGPVREGTTGRTLGRVRLCDIVNGIGNHVMVVWYT